MTAAVSGLAKILGVLGNITGTLSLSFTHHGWQGLDGLIRKCPGDQRETRHIGHVYHTLYMMQM